LETYRDRMHLALEAPRGLAELASFATTAPLLSQAPRGDGHPVLVMPGFGASDRSTAPLRGYLSTLGYRAHGWKLGVNRGPAMEDLPAGLMRRLNDVFDASGSRQVSLVGWSLGGVYARLLGQLHPDRVRQVVTLGSPFAWRSGSGYGGASRLEQLRRLAGAPLAMPSTAVFSKSDAIVPWQIATQTPSERAENIEVYGSHVGLGFNPAVLYAVADRLASREDRWQPFHRRGWRIFVYGPARLVESGAETRAAGP
jgi:pimeloyl-ACP methyl ester carboxylesterase